MTKGGSPEALAFGLVPAEGIPKKDFDGKAAAAGLGTMASTPFSARFRQRRRLSAVSRGLHHADRYSVLIGVLSACAVSKLGFQGSTRLGNA